MGAVAVGLTGAVDGVSLLVGRAAGVALFRFKAGVIPVIAAGAGVGLVLTLFH